MEELFHWNKINNAKNIQQISDFIRCNGLEVLKIARRYHYVPTTNISDFDLVSILYQMINEMIDNPTFLYVKEYRDELGVPLDFLGNDKCSS